MSITYYFLFQHWVNGNGPTEEHPYPLPAIIYCDPVSCPGQKRPAIRPLSTNKMRKRLDRCGEIPATAQPSTSQHTTDQDNHYSSNKPHKSCNSCGSAMSKITQGQMKRDCFRSEVLKSDENCFDYTGVVNIVTLMYIFQWLAPFTLTKLLRPRDNTDIRTMRKRHLSLFEEFLLTLVRIKKGYDTRNTGFLFAIPPSNVSNIFASWIRFLSQCLTPLVMWPGREEVSAHSPNSFKIHPKTRCIIGCVEYAVEKQLRPVAQWSNRTKTLKQLVGIMPNGVFTYLSKVYCGSLSHLQLVQKSDFLDMVEEGDDIMADWRFDIKHLLSRKNATLNMSGLRPKKNLCKNTAKSKALLNVERAKRRLKTFKILSGTIPKSLRHNIDEIVTICAFLCNLQGALA